MKMVKLGCCPDLDASQSEIDSGVEKADKLQLRRDKKGLFLNCTSEDAEEPG
jgi:hypothetical protein